MSKCSLRVLHGREHFTFLKANKGFVFNATGFITLGLDAPILSAKDAGPPLLLLDSTWRLLPQLCKCIEGEPIYRTLPPEVETAYPRVSKIAADPISGLASVEALYLALRILGADDLSLLEAYYWRDKFLENVTKAGL